MTIVLQTGETITGVLEGTGDGVVSIRRLIKEPYRTVGGRAADPTYADIPRHFAISAVIGAYYTAGS